MHAKMTATYSKAISNKEKKMDTNRDAVEEAGNQVVRQFAKTRDLLRQVLPRLIIRESNHLPCNHAVNEKLYLNYNF